MTAKAQFEFDDKTLLLIDKIRVIDHINRSTVLRRALALYDLAMESDQAGSEIIIRNGDKETRVIVSCSRRYDSEKKPKKHIF